MGKKMYDALKDVNDMSLVRLREQHRLDPLWCDMKFGDWLEVNNSYREQRGHARGFREGVKAGLARLQDAAPAISTKTLALFWSVLVPALAVVNSLLLLLAMRLAAQDYVMWFALVMVLLPATVVAQATGTVYLFHRLYNWILKRPDDGEVIVIKIPLEKADEDVDEDGYSRFDTQRVQDAINEGTSNSSD